MGHYDECRPGYCPSCGAAPRNIKDGVCEFCKKNAVLPPLPPLLKEDKVLDILRPRAPRKRTGTRVNVYWFKSTSMAQVQVNKRVTQDVACTSLEQAESILQGTLAALIAVGVTCSGEVHEL